MYNMVLAALFFLICSNGIIASDPDYDPMLALYITTKSGLEKLRKKACSDIRYRSAMDDFLKNIRDPAYKITDKESLKILSDYGFLNDESSVHDTIRIAMLCHKRG